MSSDVKMWYFRIGFTVIRSQQPHSGLLTYIGGKEVQLDCQIPRSQFPGFEQQATSEVTELEPTSEEVKNPVNVRSFYGISKPKASGPL
jgi:DNA repair and recombination protein RAD54B